MIKLFTYFYLSVLLVSQIAAQEIFYPDQEKPTTHSKLFSPGFISSFVNERDIAIHPNGREVYYCIHSADNKFGSIFWTRFIDNEWTKPEVLKQLSDVKFVNMEPNISPDGKKLFFYSNRPNGDKENGGADIWVMDRKGDRWSEPYNLGEPVNSIHKEFFPSVTNDGTLYFTRAEKGSRIHNIYRSKLVDGKYQEPELLPKEVNSGRTQFNAMISPDESFIIVPVFGREDSFGFTDYYISYRTEDDKWDGPYNLGKEINSPNWTEYSPALSPDGKYFFFQSAKRDLPTGTISYEKVLEYSNSIKNGSSNIYWISSDVLKKEFVKERKNENK